MIQPYDDGCITLEGLEFVIEDAYRPAAPLKHKGELWHEGWDIPTKFAVDADNECWMNNAHGHALCHVSAAILIGTAENEFTQNSIRRILGMELPMPEWARTAAAAGWTPPAGWTWTKR